MGETFLAVRRAALAVYQTHGEHPNAVVLDKHTIEELEAEAKADGTIVAIHPPTGKLFIAGMIVLEAHERSERGRRIILPVYADLGIVIRPHPFARSGAAA